MKHRYLNITYHDADQADLDPRTVIRRIRNALMRHPHFGFWGI
jgi:hypothetical protein